MTLKKLIYLDDPAAGFFFSDIYVMALKKHFYTKLCISTSRNMPRRRLNVLINLGEHARHNQARTIKRKVLKGASVPIPIPKCKENKKNLKVNAPGQNLFITMQRI